MRTSIFLMALLLLATNIRAQTVRRAPWSAHPRPVVIAKRIAVVPWGFDKGTELARTTANEFLTSLLADAKLAIIPESETRAAWDSLNNSAGSGGTGGAHVLMAAQLVRLGQALGADWVLAPRASWHTRYIWVSLGSKTKSTCTVDAEVVDVRHQAVVLDARGVSMDDTDKEDPIRVIGGILISESLAPGNWNWVPGNEFRSSNPAVVDYCSMNFFRGGPKAPREQCAVQLAMAKALAPWLTEQHKIGTASPSSE